MKNTATTTPLSRILSIIAGLLIAVAIFVPLWRIELDAPQYPEGLALIISANNIGGDVNTINGLNHYIGMKTLHTEDFIEFTILPYILAAFALLFSITGVAGKRFLLVIATYAFIIFGILSMVDFYQWNYNYGHNLNPDAAIRVPGMAYQPPLIGYKQLLNFGAYSMPDIGGWLLCIAGLLSMVAVVREMGWADRFLKNSKAGSGAVALCVAMLLHSCSDAEPRPIERNKDNCEACKMTVADKRFATQLVTKKGRQYIFDDLSCMVTYSKGDVDIAAQYVPDYNTEALLKADDAIYVYGEDVGSPMGGNVAAFSSQEAATRYAESVKGTVLTFADAMKKFD